MAKIRRGQPPSRGCVLKRFLEDAEHQKDLAAAFARLCVETPPTLSSRFNTSPQPPSRGCVLKH